MGQALSNPVSSQLLQRAGNKTLRCGSAEMQGFRISMEDTHSMKTSLSKQHPDISFFGVYDGHAGDKASLFLEQKMHEAIAGLKDPMNPQQIRDACLRVDAEFLKNEEDRQHGSACCFALVRSPKPEDKKDRKWQITVANIGDSRALLIRADGTCVPLTNDHKPELEGERDRIQKAGGFVQQNRVDGQLAMSRAMGDWPYKDNSKLKPEDQKVIAVPEVTTEVGYDGDSLLVCCDGIVEQLNNQQVGAFVHEQRAKLPDDPALVAGKLLTYSLEKGSKDNHSALLITFKSGEGYESKDQFIAGPFRPFQNDKKFVECYLADAEKHGYKGAELMRMAAEAEKNMPAIKEEPDHSANIMGALTAQLGNLPGDNPREKLLMLASLLSGGGLSGRGDAMGDDDGPAGSSSSGGGAGGASLTDLLFGNSGMDMSADDEDMEGSDFGFSSGSSSSSGGASSASIEELEDDEDADDGDGKASDSESSSSSSSASSPGGAAGGGDAGKKKKKKKKNKKKKAGSS